MIRILALISTYCLALCFFQPPEILTTSPEAPQGMIQPGAFCLSPGELSLGLAGDLCSAAGNTGGWGCNSGLLSAYLDFIKEMARQKLIGTSWCEQADFVTIMPSRNCKLFVACIRRWMLANASCGFIREIEISALLARCQIPFLDHV